MSDATLRELERRVALTPGDGRARLELATAFSRAGQRRRALAALDLAWAHEDWFAPLKQLSDDLWRQELATFEPAFTIEGESSNVGITVEFCGFDPDSRWVVARRSVEYVGLGDSDTGLLVHSLPDGRRLGMISLETPDALFGGPVRAARGMFFVNSYDTIDRYTVTGNEVLLADSRPQGRDRRRVVAVSPSGLWTLLVGEHFVGVTRWPDVDSGTNVRVHVEIDWDRELLVHYTGGLTRFDGKKAPPFRTGNSPVVYALGQGLVAALTNGVTLFSFDERWQTSLFSDFDSRTSHFAHPSLARDGRSVRFVVGSRLVRAEVDLATGKLRSPPAVSVPEDASPVEGAFDSHRDHFWHPCADVVALGKDDEGDRPGRLLALDGSTLLELDPGSTPVGWSPDGVSLAVITGENLLEIWQGADSPGARRS